LVLVLNDWYVAPGATANTVLKVRHGIIQEIGLANQRLTKGRTAQGRFLSSASGVEPLSAAASRISPTSSNSHLAAGGSAPRAGTLSASTTPAAASASFGKTNRSSAPGKNPAPATANKRIAQRSRANMPEGVTSPSWSPKDTVALKAALSG
jgi:hypothetical protein